jgi:hypothetical protein
VRTVELRVGERAQPAEDVILAALAQAIGELLGSCGGRDHGAPPVPRIALAHREAALLEPVDQEAGRGLADAEAPAQLADRRRAVGGYHDHGLELPHGEVAREQLVTGAAVQRGEDLVSGLMAIGDTPLVA